MALIHALKKQGKWFIASCLLAVVLVLIAGYLYIHSIEEDIKFYRAEQAMAKAYKPNIREALFNIVIDNEQYQNLNTLGEELDRTLKIMSNRLGLRYYDMSKSWQEWFTPFDSNNLINKALHNQGRRSYTEYFSYLSQFNELTVAEKEYMQLVRDIWYKHDNFIKTQRLDSVHFGISGISGRQTHNGKDSMPYFSVTKVDGECPNADDLAAHYFNFVKELYQLPRTVNNFFYDIQSLEESKVKSKTAQEQDTIINKQKTLQLIDIMRHYNYYNTDNSALKDLSYHYQIQFKREVGAVVIKFYKGYIKVSGVIDDFDTIYDYVQTKYHFIPMINGVYKVDTKLIEDIELILTN